MAGSWPGCLGGEALQGHSCLGGDWTTERHCYGGAALRKHYGLRCARAEQKPSTPPHPTPCPQHHQPLHPSRGIPIRGQTHSDTMTCVFHLLLPILYSYHSGSTSFPPNHLPIQFVDLPLLSRSLVTPCGQVQGAFPSPHLPCPLL